MKMRFLLSVLAFVGAPPRDTVTAAVPVDLGGGSVLDFELLQQWFEEQRGTVSNTAVEEPQVTLKNGTLKGTTYTALGGDTIYAYLGIPYAEAPVGALRFQPPQPYNHAWSGIRAANRHPNACSQHLTNTTIASEDCLYVSVYTKKAPGDASGKLPVMYWIHGGGFLLGQTSYYTASKLLQNDVVLVTVQYRMGPFGFLSMQDEVLPGNMGMKDMVQGLRWVQENIEAFSGDKDRVTVFGESAGGAASIFMLISPLAKGLFHRVAAMSGTALAEWSIDRDPLGSTRKLATALNCSDISTSHAILSCLRDIPPQTISQAHFSLMLGTQASTLRANLAGTSPTLEWDYPGAFLPSEPLTLLESGDLEDVPVLLGANQHEGSFILGVAWAIKLAWNGTMQNETYVHEKLFGDLMATWGVDESRNGASISQVLSAAYLPPDNPRTDFSTFQYELIDMTSALFMKAPVLRTAEILSRRLSQKVYLYSFEYPSRTSSLWNFIGLIPLLLPELEPLLPPFDGGVTHGDDLTYMFSLPLPPSQKDREMTPIYTRFFTEFAGAGKPSADWPEFSTKEPNYMQIVHPTPTPQRHYQAGWRQGLTNDWEK